MPGVSAGLEGEDETFTGHVPGGAAGAVAALRELSHCWQPGSVHVVIDLHGPTLSSHQDPGVPELGALGDVAAVGVFRAGDDEAGGDEGG